MKPQSILANTAIATTGRAVNVVLGVVATAVISRLLGPANYGAYVLLFSFGVIIQLAADLGSRQEAADGLVPLQVAVDHQGVLPAHPLERGDDITDLGLRE